MYRNGIKRLLAIVLSLCGMVCLSWLFLILAVAIKLDSPGPVFFKQKRSEPVNGQDARRISCTAVDSPVCLC